MWLSGRSGIIKALEGWVTLGQLSERRAEVSSGFTELPIGATSGYFVLGPGKFHRQSRPLSCCLVSWKLCWKTIYFSDWQMICIFFLISLSKTKFQASWSPFLHSTLFPKTAKCMEAPDRVFLAREELFQSGLSLVLYLSLFLNHYFSTTRAEEQKGETLIILNSRSPKSWRAGAYTEASPLGYGILLQDGLLSSR